MKTLSIVKAMTIVQLATDGVLTCKTIQGERGEDTCGCAADLKSRDFSG